MLVSADATSQRQKTWVTSVFYLQVKILATIVAKKYALKAANVIINQSKYDPSGPPGELLTR